MNQSEVNKLSEFFKALSNPHRLRLFLKCLSCCPDQSLCSTETYQACVGEVSDGLNIAPSTVSHHIKALSHVGLITMKRSGKHIHCGLSQPSVNLFQKLVGSLWAH